MNWIPFFSPDPKARLGRRKRSALHALALCSLLFVLAGCDEVVKEPAPDFTLELFDGGSFSLSEHKGRPVVINFFASWCIPCKAEAPALDKVYREYKIKNVAFLGIAIQDTESKAMAFVEENGVTFPAGLDKDNAIKDLFGVYGIPATYFIDKNGIINYIHAGILTEDLIRYELDKIL
ncbi:MAG: TlpA family protein disulfide reductase [Rhodospirillaceae bacterium]|nr:TlpA family protein disulfide reductase [Rhodospirillaceae bacterium]